MYCALGTMQFILHCAMRIVLCQLFSMIFSICLSTQQCALYKTKSAKHCWAFPHNIIVCCISGLRNASRRFELAGLKVGVVMVVALCEPECWSNGAQPIFKLTQSGMESRKNLPTNLIWHLIKRRYLGLYCVTLSGLRLERERGRLAMDNCAISPENLDNFVRKRTLSSAGVMIFFKIMTIIAIIVIRLHEGSAESKWPFVWLEQHLGRGSARRVITIPLQLSERTASLLCSWQVYIWCKLLQKVYIWYKLL